MLGPPVLLSGNKNEFIVRSGTYLEINLHKLRLRIFLKYLIFDFRAVPRGSGTFHTTMHRSHQTL